MFTAEKEMTIVMKKRKRHINFDILGEILFRLPYKSLLRAKSVCHSWNSLIINPQFSQTYKRINKHYIPPRFLTLDRMPKTVIMYSIGRDRFTLAKSAGSIPMCYTKLVSSSRGLVCISGGYWSETLAVFNPTTNELLLLPHHPHSLLAFFVFPGILGDESEYADELEGKYLNAVSFGYHPPTNKYKVVQMLRDPGGRVTRCYVLSVSRRHGACCWREIEESLMCQVRFGMHSWCIDGVIYWENFTFAGESVDIISFDLGTEKLKLVPSPWRCESSHRSQPTRHLVELQNKLCFVKTECNNSDNGEQLQMDIWMLMKDDSVGDLKSWTHMHRLDLGPCPHDHPFTAYFPLCVDLYNNRILLFDQGNYEDSLMYVYHLNDKILERYNDYEPDDDEEYPLIFWLTSRGYNCVTYTEALALLD